MNDTLKSIFIGNIRIDPPLFLAPMAGQTNHTFRTLCRQQGGLGLVCTELISSQAMQHKGARERTFRRMFDWMDDIRPVAVQLFGGSPYEMAEAAKIVVDHGADIVDINMGCWVPKVAKTGSGAALMRDICTATAVVKAVVDAVKVPVTVEIRARWSPDNPTCVPFAQAAEDAGVTAIAVHARFAVQGHSGDADWDWITKVKQTVKHIPIIGNGDIWTGEDAKRMMERTGCDGVMVGRAAIGNPWVFSQIHHYLLTGETLPMPSVLERVQMAQTHARRTIATSNLTEIQTIRELRGQLLRYTVGMNNATSIREGINHAETLVALEQAFAPVLEMETIV